MSYIPNLSESLKTKVESTLSGYQDTNSLLLPFILHHTYDCFSFKDEVNIFRNSVPKSSSELLKQNIQESSTNTSSCQCEIDKTYLKSNLITKNEKPLPDWFILDYRLNRIVKDIADILTKSFFISPPQIEIRSYMSNYLVAERIVSAIHHLFLNLSSSNTKVAKNNIEESDTNNDTQDTSELSNKDDLKEQKCTKVFKKTYRKRGRKVKVLNDESEKTWKKHTLKWYLRKDANLCGIEIEKFIDNDFDLPDLANLKSLTGAERKDLFLDVVSIDFRDHNMPIHLEYLAIITLYWFKNTKFSLNKYHLQTLVTCFLMFNVLDGKQKYRNKSDFDKIDNIKKNLATQSDNSKVSSDSSIKELIENLSFNECLVASHELFKYHHFNDKFCKKNYSRDTVHKFGEFQACVYFANALNGILLSPYECISMDCIWSGTFSFNIFDYLEESRNPLGFLNKVFEKDSNLFNIFLKLHNKLANIINDQWIISCNDDLSENTSVNQQRKSNRSKKSKASKKRAKEVDEIDKLLLSLQLN